MKLLLTGAAGFIGSHSAKAFLDDNWNVVGADNFDPFYPKDAKLLNLKSLSEHPAFTFAQCDLRDNAQVQKLFAEHGPFDAVCHLAARAGVRPSIADPLGYNESNITATLNLLQCCIKQPTPPKFVFASSSSVYGNNLKTPFSEADRVDNPISPYAATKKAGELICHTFHHLYGMDVFCLRFFTVYGPAQRPDLAIRKFADLILHNKPIEMFGDGSTSRDYTYIDDIVFGVKKSVELCKGYEIINLGSKTPITLREMIDTVAAACGKTPQIINKPMQPGDVERTFADIAKAQQILGYNPQTPFAEGVQNQVNWMREQ